MAIITLDHIECRAGELRYAFSADAQAATHLWDARELVISSSAPPPSDEARLAAAFFLALAPLGWIAGVRFQSDYPLATPDRECLADLGAFLGRHYGWRHGDPFADVPSAPRTQGRGRRTGLMFSGGVDSLSALHRRRSQIDTLIHLSNFDYESTTLTRVQRAAGPASAANAAARAGFEVVLVETNLAGVIRHADLDRWFPPRCTFWYGLQHVNHIAVVGAVLTEPFDPLLVAGSVDEQHRRIGSWAASPLLINRYRVGSRLDLVESGVWRLRKIEYLLDVAPEALSGLRVCYTSGDGTCATCGKCMWTALMIVAGGGSLARTSFPPEIRGSLLAELDSALEVGPRPIPMLHQSFAGRALEGTPRERMKQLRDRVANSP